MVKPISVLGFQHPLPFLLGALACATCMVAPSLSFAQASGVQFDNASIFVPLQGGSITSFTAEGNITTACQSTVSGSCEGLAQGQGASAEISLSSSTVAVGIPVTVTWDAPHGADICLASSPSFIQGWSGLVSPQGGSTVITANAEGTAPLALKCFNTSGSVGGESVLLTVGAGGPPPSAGCQVVKSEILDPFQRALFQPEGFTRVEKTWSQVFNGQPYPQTMPDFYPVGSWTLAGLQYSPAPTLRGKYLTIPFQTIGAPRQFQWNSAKPVYGYQPARFTMSVYLTVTACPGDFRLASEFQYVSPDPARDPSFVRQCRSTNTSEALLSHAPSANGMYFCPVEAGSTYYLNIVFADALDGLSPFETGCADTSAAVCEISMKHVPTI